MHNSTKRATNNNYKSLLPLTDPLNAEAQRMLNIPYRIIL